MKKRGIVSIAFLFVLVFALKIDLFASELDNTIQSIQYTDEYEQWLDLDDKEKYIEPNKYAVNSTYSNTRNNLTFKSALYSKLMIANYDSYDLRRDITITVKNQLSTGQCWAFASNSVIETNIEKTTGNNSPLFSARYLEYATALNFTDGKNEKAYNRNIGSGGVSEIAFNFYASGNGPVLESDMPFENNSDRIGLSSIENLEVQKQLNEFVRFPSIYKTYNGDNIIYKNASGDEYTFNDVLKIRNSIKEHILQYGAVTAQTLGSGTVSQDAKKYYNNPDSIRNSIAYYCNNPQETPNHQVTIIGWDDSYEVSNFNSNCQPSNPGAYIVLNSWGENFGENGVYYISYEDCLIEETIIGVKSVSNITYDKIYQYDNLGNNALYCVNSNIYGATVFTREDLTENEFLNQIAVSSLVDSKCDIYVNVMDSDLDLSKCVQVKKDYIITNGYHTINLDEPLKIQGEKFVVIVKYLTDDNGQAYLPLEAPDEFFWKTATGGDDRCFIATDLNNWTDINDLKTLPKNSDLCLKAFTIYEKNEEQEQPTEPTGDIGDNEEQPTEPTDNIGDNEEQPTEPEDNKENNSEDQETDLIDNSEIKSQTYIIKEGYILGISPKTSYEEFLNNISIEEQYSIVPEDANVLQTGNLMYIGDKIYVLVIKGDLDGNGKVSITDVVKARLHLSNILTLKNEFLKAMDVNLDEKISITDVVMINLASINMINI